jgi:hypothetical protein
MSVADFGLDKGDYLSNKIFSDELSILRSHPRFYSSASEEWLHFQTVLRDHNKNFLTMAQMAKLMKHVFQNWNLNGDQRRYFYENLWPKIGPPIPVTHGVVPQEVLDKLGTLDLMDGCSYASAEHLYNTTNYVKKASWYRKRVQSYLFTLPASTLPYRLTYKPSKR